MTSQPSYLFASLKQPDEAGVTALVTFGLVTTEDEVFYLVIRYIDYPNIVEGDHLYHSLEEVLEAASAEYGIGLPDWRDLSADEISEVGANIR
ncbi:hypothetical protein AUC61_11390 [Pseudomonas sp. S25]|uniref:Uncharacterized protein n=1 Tax=Pseudomonas maioricensis TaxID=1766623 RepID=A0ABS9ZHR6_9PSED|nr:hypothetical protein [Pseudomonas sp. S25]MCI8210139.1 hypothetical protein [Pseudomonas sp. S25]